MRRIKKSVMDWDKAKKIIQQQIVQGTDLNTKRSKLRKVLQDNYQCTRYDYNGENGFLISIGRRSNNNLEIPWGMLEKCFYALNESDGYNGEVFRRHYPQQAKNHPCHVHVVGMVFKKAGIAESDAVELNYYLKKN